MADLFVFYRSFRDAIREMDEREQLETLLALCDYALDGIEPDLPTPMQRAVLTIAKPLIDSSNKSREAGKRGGRPSSKNNAKTPVKTPLYNPHQNQQEQEQEQEQEASIKNAADAASKKTPAPAENPRLDTGLSEIIRRYEDDVGSFPRSALDSLQRWRQTLGDDLLVLAISEAAENNARSWRYIDRVLSSWQKEGVRTVGDVQARRERKSSSVDAGPQYERLT